MEEYLGRKLLKGEDVHHLDGNKSNNDIKNLKVIDKSNHTKLHHAIKKGVISYTSP